MSFEKNKTFEWAEKKWVAGSTQRLTQKVKQLSSQPRDVHICNTPEGHIVMEEECTTCTALAGSISSLC